jgi:hypothetical protein
MYAQFAKNSDVIASENSRIRSEKRSQQPVLASRRDTDRQPFSLDQWHAKHAVPYIAIPVWWRGFFSRVLEPIDVAIYTYICSRMGESAVAFPDIAQIRSAVNRTNNPVRKSLAHLVARGFLLMEEKPKPLPRSQVAVRYQRPHALSTVRTLLSQGVIDDSFLYIISKRAQKPDRLGTKPIMDVRKGEPDAIVARGLKATLGPALCSAYLSLRRALYAESSEIKVAALLAVIDARLIAKTARDVGEDITLARNNLKAIGADGKLPRLPASILDSFRPPLHLQYASDEDYSDRM